MKKRILVTGGMGFIGSHYIRTLLAEEPEVEVVNADALKYASNPLNVRDVEDHPRYHFRQVDLSRGDDVAELFAEERIDEIVHFAAESHVDRSIQSSLPFLKSNITGTYHLLEEVQKAGSTIRMVQVSTDEVYGSVDEGHTSEDTVLAPGNPYSASKAGADLFCLAYYKTHGVPVVITRCTNNYGPNQHPEKLIPRLILRALKGRTLPLYGDGRQERDWIHVRDHCRGVELVRKKGELGEIYHIGAEKPVANLEIAKRIAAALQQPLFHIQHVRDRPGHDRRYSLDTSKIRRELGWEPVIPLDEGLTDTIRWYQQQTDWYDGFMTDELKERTET
ncbi:dTDP-glucose 4,6-dehydratase [Desmospora profundinema]|uniref:dTDP-glucose 4,6-dehydratase n=1 Tax=Desmospora profundinema TaxID=1571184 RepID=A0ABU1IHP5_9BACL|nr:dTDP-glucose 4,6-dehydratase [Desmospora profundinema]MDR6224300.1 dTDP-glucose 4,6-dehydratase [Desmospora profundinema]